MKEKILSIDTSRFVHYEGIWHGKREMAHLTAVESTMYHNPHDIERRLKEGAFEKPFLCVEYSHAMGNSNGNLFQYTDLFKYEGFFGGFIWDYIDQAIINKDVNGNEYIAYGGQFDRLSETTFCGNGIVFADRTNSPKMQEVKACYRFVDIKPTKNSVEITNNYNFTNLSEFTFVQTILQNGKKVYEIPFDVDVKPGETKEVKLSSVSLSGEISVVVSMQLKADTAYEKKGYELCFGQYVYTEKEQKEPVAKGKLELVGDRTPLQGVHGENFSVGFSAKEGAMISYVYEGKEMLFEPVKLNFWRAVTDNDRGAEIDYKSVVWKSAGQNARYTESKNYMDGKNAVFEYNFRPFFGNENVNVLVKYTIMPDGKIHIGYKYSGAENLPDYVCAGLMVSLKKEFENLEWYGLGYEETYIDKFVGGKIGIYSSKVEDQFVKYLRPQDCANHYQTRWMTLTDDDNKGLMFKGDSPIDMSALNYTPDEIESAIIPTYLPQAYCTRAFINGFMCGVGGDTSWSAPVHPEFMKPANEPLEFGFTLIPYSK